MKVKNSSRWCSASRKKAACSPLKNRRSVWMDGSTKNLNNSHKDTKTNNEMSLLKIMFINLEPESTAHVCDLCFVYITDTVHTHRYNIEASESTHFCAGFRCSK